MMSSTDCSDKLPANQSPPASTQTSNQIDDRLDFDPGDGGGCTNVNEPPTKKQKFINEKCGRAISNDNNACEPMSEEFEIIDETGEYENGDDDGLRSVDGLSNDDDGTDDASDDDIDDNEIYAWLDEGMERKKTTSDGDSKDEDSTPCERNKIVLIELGRNPFEILPEGWVAITHNSGMPLFLHKDTRVCTLSKPYFLGPGSARKHDVPLSAVPCLQYRREKEKETKNEAKTDKPTNSITSVNETTEKPLNAAATLINSKEVSAVRANDGTTGFSLLSAPPVKIECANDRKRENSLDAIEIRKYCEKLFEFKTITVKRFKTWKDRRDHISRKKKQSRPALPSSTKLITCPIVPGSSDDISAKRKEFVLNPRGKSSVCILHEYIQHAMRIQPQYIFKELENAQTPYSATVVINNVEYGTGYASSKRNAKMEAARVSLGVLIPEMNNSADNSVDSEDLSFFDEIKIEDPRVYELCIKAGQPSPYQILLECLKRNYGMGDTQCKMNMNTLKNQKSEYTLQVGKHKATVVCKNKRDGKQQSSQAILQLLHPHIISWGSLLRLYGRASFKTINEKKQEQTNITELQAHAKSKGPNTAVLDKLRQDMRILMEQRAAVKSKGKFRMDGARLPGNVVTSLDL